MNIPVTLLVLFVFLPLSGGGLLFLFPERGRKILPMLFMVNSILAGYMIYLGFEERVVFSGSFGVEIAFDGPGFILTLMNGIVFLAVSLSLADRPFPPITLSLISMLHGTANAVFISNDLFNVFVCVDLAGILGFLLIRMGRKPRQVWSAVKYLLTANVGMIFYLLGCLQVYTHTGSFSISTLGDVPPVAVALLLTGLSVKGGILAMGLWLPEAHGEAEAEISALLSGVIVKVGLAPMFRIASVSSLAHGFLSFIGPIAAIWGVCYAMAEKDLKKMLAYSTLSQVGFAISVPALGPFYAASHGVAKAWLFLSAGRMPGRSIEYLQNKGVEISSWLPLILGSLVIAGMPGFALYSAKGLIMSSQEGWKLALLYLASLGTAIYYSKLLFIPPLRKGKLTGRSGSSDLILLGALIAGGYRVGSYGISQIFSSLSLLLSGIALYLLLRERVTPLLPYWQEEIDHILGLTLLFCLLIWGVFAL